MKHRIKIVTSILVFLSWYMAFAFTSNPRFTFDLLPSIPVTYNPFVMIKWLVWDNPRLVMISLFWFVAASCATYVYARVYEALWEGNETVK